MMRNKWFGLIVLAVAFLFGLVVYPQLPEIVAVQWDAQGNVSNSMTREMATFFVPVLGLFVWGLLILVPNIDPKKANFPKFAGTYWLISSSVMLILGLVYIAQNLVALGIELPMARIGIAVVGLLFLILGNEMGRFRPNWFAGIRTPWTLSNDEVWRRTHRVGGRLFFGGGIAILVLGLVLSTPLAFGMILTVAFGVIIYTMIYSYWLFRRLEAENTVVKPSK